MNRTIRPWAETDGQIEEREGTGGGGRRHPLTHFLFPLTWLGVVFRGGTGQEQRTREQEDHSEPWGIGQLAARTQMSSRRNRVNGFVPASLFCVHQTPNAFANQARRLQTIIAPQSPPALDMRSPPLPTPSKSNPAPPPDSNMCPCAYRPGGES